MTFKILSLFYINLVKLTTVWFRINQNNLHFRVEGVDEGHGQRQPHAVGKEVTERSFIPLFRIMIMLATVCQELAIRNHAIYSCHIEDRPLQFKLGCLVLSEKRCLVTFWHFFINYCCIHGPMRSMHVHVYICPHPLVAWCLY